MRDDASIESLYATVLRGVADWSSARYSVSQLVQHALQSECSQADADSKTKAEIQAHPLGFCAFRWRLAGGRALRVHIWSRNFRWKQSPFWPIHDHVFDFSSAVLEGRLVNKSYSLRRLDEETALSCGVYEVDYLHGASSMRLKQPQSRLSLESVQVVNRGETYGMKAGVLHRSKLVADFAVTVLATNNRAGHAVPRVIGDGKVNELVFQRALGWNSAARCQVLEIVRSMLV